MRVVLFIVIGLVAIIAVAAAVGSMLPKGHVARRSASFARPVPEVWAVITDFAAQPAWRSDVRAAVLVRGDGGSVGATWREEGSNTLTLETTEQVVPTRLVRTIADPSLPFGGKWIYELSATATGGTTLTITEDGEVYNPIFRVVSKFMNQAATIEGYLAALDRRLNASSAR